MTFTIKKSGPALSAEDFRDLEIAIGRPVPVEYREFLLSHNGGYPEPAGFAIQDSVIDEQTGTVDWFLGVGGEETLTLTYIFDVFGDRVPAEFFPIARDPGGNLIGLLTSEERRGEVVFWEHEEEADEGEPPTWDNIYHVADDFQQFVAGLR